MKYSTKYGTVNIGELDTKYIGNLKSGVHPCQKDIDTMLSEITPNSVVADIGANIGIMMLPFARHAKEVHCFEPIERNLELLRKNIEDNKLTNVFVHPVGLGRKEGKADFYIETPANAGTFRAREGNTYNIKTLDSFGIKFDFLKIDTQGMEEEVLRGASLVLKSKPKLFFEVGKRNREYGSIKGLSDCLKGYSFYIPWKVPSIALAFALKRPGTFFFNREGTDFDVLAI